MLDKETCKKLWNNIIEECDKQVNKYNGLLNESKISIKNIKKSECSECQKKLKKSYEDMIETCNNSIEKWNKQKENALLEIEKCNML